MIGAGILPVGRCRYCFQLRQVPASGAKEVLSSGPCRTLIEVGSIRRLFNNVSEGYDLSVDAYLGQLLLGVERPEPADVPAPDRNLFALAAPRFFVADVALQEGQGLTVP